MLNHSKYSQYAKLAFKAGHRVCCFSMEAVTTHKSTGVSSVHVLITDDARPLIIVLCRSVYRGWGLGNRREWRAWLERHRDMWYFLLLHQPGDDYLQQFQSQLRKDHKSLQLNDWGYVLESGEGEYPSQQVKYKVCSWTVVRF